jgi:hypothetical protein
MGKGSSSTTPATPSPSRFSGKGGRASPAPQNPYASQQAPQSQYASPLSGLGAIYGQYQQPSQFESSGAFTMDMVPQRRAMDYSGGSYTGGSSEFPEEFYPVPITQPPPPITQPPPQYQQPNPYAMPFQQRYVQRFNPAPAQFVPKSAKDYRSPFQGSGMGKGNRGERTYFNRPVEKNPAETNPADKSQEGIANRVINRVINVAHSSPDDYYYSGYSSMPGAASGGVIKAATGQYLQGPGDGTSDSIPATIGNAQPARLADGEFVIDARTVSEIGNGSSNAGAKKLYAMMERVHRERKRAKRGQDSNADRFLPR